jgi:hypothetical protein
VNPRESSFIAPATLSLQPVSFRCNPSLHCKATITNAFHLARLRLRRRLRGRAPRRGETKRIHSVQSGGSTSASAAGRTKYRRPSSGTCSIIMSHSASVNTSSQAEPNASAALSAAVGSAAARCSQPRHQARRERHHACHSGAADPPGVAGTWQRDHLKLGRALGEKRQRPVSP